MSLVAGVTKDCTDKFSAADIIRTVAGKIGGKGGGRADMAQGGGNNSQLLKSALKDLEIEFKGRL